MEPPKLSEIREPLTKESLEERIAFAKHIGNQKMDAFRLREAITLSAKDYFRSKGISEEKLHQAISRYVPPAWHGMPTTGTVKVFALLIEFPDYLHKNEANIVQSMLFGSPTTGTPYESLANYYKRASYNLLNLSGGATLGWYKSNKKRSDIVKDDNGRDSLIKEALLHFKTQGHNFAQYDNDNDGVIDYFMVFWTGPDTGWATFWWGYQPNFSDPSFKLDGKSLGKYSWQWESNPVGTAFTPRVAIHETGHALGLPDLYDYKGNVGPNGGVGGADMMDKNWLDHNCFSKWMLSWVKPTIIGSGTNTVTINPSGNSKDCVAIWPYLDEGELFSEMYMVQNRQPVENDKELPGKGLMIWHIDARLNQAGDNFAFDNSYAPHKLVRLMEADGLEDIEANRGFNAGDLYKPGKTLGPNTKPSSARYDGKSSFIEISKIAAAGPQMTAVINVGLLYHAVWGWARKDFDKHQSEMKAKGYYLGEINAYVPPGATDAAWNGIWEDRGEDWTAVWGWARKDFDKRAAELQNQGFRLLRINAYVPPGAADAAWNGIWTKTEEPTHHAVWGWARKDFDKHASELHSQGYHLVEINAYVPPGATDAAWNGIWVKRGDELTAVWGWARKDFDKRAAELQNQGFRLLRINAYVPPGAADAAWNGIWTKSGKDSTAVWGWARNDFDKHQSELGAKGYRLVEINAYVPPGAKDAAWNAIWVKS
jgi:M6 family metalloprotease-like protein